MKSTTVEYFEDKLEAERDYWLQKLSGEPALTGIPLDFKRPGVFSDERRLLDINIDEETQNRLLKICGNNELLVFTALITTLKICLHKYAGAEDIIIGTTIHERYGEVATLNKVLALRDEVSREMTVKQLLSNVKRTLSEAYTHQKYPFERLINLLNLELSGNRAPLFNVAVILENINNRENIRHLKNDVTLVFSLKDDGIRGVIEYNPALFKRETIAVFAEHYQAALSAVVSDPSMEVSKLELLSQDKKQEFIFGLNSTQADYPKNKTIHQLFEEQVERTPSNVAVTYEDQHLTYRELNNRANQLAHHLQKLGVKSGVLVGVYLNHSLESIVALLGILKTGAAYVPLDPEHPQARLAFMLSDARVPVLLTQESLVEKLPAIDAQVIRLDADWQTIAQESRENQVGQAAPEDLAYVIYTSGSTGDPKGVKIQHAALVNYVWWAKKVYLRDDELAFPLYSSLAFDLTVTMIYTPLVTGNRIIAYRQEENETPLLDLLKDNQVGVLKLTPSHISLIKDHDNRQSRIKRMIVGGEAFETELAARVLERFGAGIEIFNEYGPTEATVGCMIHRFDAAKDDRAFVPIGKPADNVQIYVLDEWLNPVPENVIGELYIAGDGLAQGYLNRDDLTAERFVDNPFVPGRKMYQTGDLARWLPEGVLEFVGRNDDQVKFHGYRVELSEIRSILNQHPQVRESVVVVARDKNDSDAMMAYYVARQEIDITELRAFLSEKIVEETLPNVFVHLKKLPLTINGKVDFRALPSLEEARLMLKRDFVAPRTPTEEALAKIWTDVLGVEHVGIHDNFFELGGHSLMATQVISRMRSAFQLEIPMRIVLDMPTVAELALTVTQMQIEQESDDEIARMIEEIKHLPADVLKDTLEKETQQQMINKEAS